MKNKWLLREKGQEEDLKSHLLKVRQINIEESKSFLNPTKADLISPYLLKDMEKVVSRINKAKNSNQLICIYGDYDVDGISSVSILLKTFNFLGINSIFYIPKRIEEGYGINTQAIDTIKKMGADLIITVDCGITSVDEIEYAKTIDLDVIVTDHHECKEILPDAIGIINPKQHECHYPYKHLCGAGIALKIAQALIDDNDSILFDELIEIACIATIADIVELSGENRVIVKNGLLSLKKTINIGLKALMEVSGINSSNINSSNIAFILAPRINSTGRMGTPELGVSLIIEDDFEEAVIMARKIEELNRERQTVELKIFEEAVALIEQKSKNNKILIASSKNWHSGVIGIVASKLTEKYNKPTFVIAIEDENIGKGSARSIDGFNLFENLLKLDECLIKFGGHNQAAGITIHEDRIAEFELMINEIAEEILNKNHFQRIIEIDSKLKLKDINSNTLKILSELEPFGIGNRKPLFCLTNYKLSNYKYIGKMKKHFKSEINDDIEIIGFNKHELINNIDLNFPVDFVFELEINSFNNKDKIQLLLRDLRSSYNYSEALKIMYDYILKCKSLTLAKNQLTKIDKDKKINFDEMLCLDGKKLLIVNTCESYFSLIERLHFYNIKPTVDFENSINDYTIILSPIIDNLDLSRYNNIVIYQSDSFLSSINIESKNIKVLSIIDKIIHTEDIVPSRETFISLYKVIMNKLNIKFYIFETCEYFRISELSFFVILEVFKELKIIDFELDYSDGSVRVKIINKLIGKKNLDETKTIKSLDFINLYDK